MNKFLVATAVALSIAAFSAEAGPADVLSEKTYTRLVEKTEKRAKRMRNTQLCLISQQTYKYLYKNPYGKPNPNSKLYNKQLTMKSVYDKELTDRGYTKAEVADISKGYIGIGMRREAAICSWQAALVGKSVGHGSYSEQYRSSGGSYFFVNRKSHVDYISQ